MGFIIQIIFSIKYTFGSAITRIDFDTNDSVKLILHKINFKLNWFIFGYIHIKVS
jgi:hypothetical protein